MVLAAAAKATGAAVDALTAPRHVPAWVVWIVSMQQAASVAAEQTLLREEFELLEDAQRIRVHHRAQGKSLAPLDPRHKIDVNRVRGCQSQVWMVAELTLRPAGCTCRPTAMRSSPRVSSPWC